MAEKKLKLSRKEVKEQLAELINLFSKVKPKKSIRIYKKTPKKIEKEKQDTLQELIDSLRVGIKYLLFANEAGRREIEYLKNLLKNKGIK